MWQMSHLCHMWREANSADRWLYAILATEIAFGIYLIWSLA